MIMSSVDDGEDEILNQLYEEGDSIGEFPNEELMTDFAD